MFVTSWCPYCHRALSWMDELQQENPDFRNLNIKVVDEEKEPGIAKQYDYYYVPTYYLDGIKVHEGAATKAIIQEIFQKSQQP